MVKKISICCAVMNRGRCLTDSVRNWMSFDEIDEIVVVDWSSDIPLSFPKSEFPKVRLYRVEHERYYNLAKSFNLSIRLAKNETIMKMDSDYVITKEFISRLPTSRSGRFITIDATASWKKSGDIEDRSLWGFIYMNKKDFLSVNGYRESLEGWGADDDDLYDRLSVLYDRMQILSNGLIKHKPHDNNDRVRNYQNKNIRDNQMKNYNMCKSTVWDCTCKMSQYILDQAGNLVRVIK